MGAATPAGESEVVDDPSILPLLPVAPMIGESVSFGVLDAGIPNAAGQLQQGVFDANSGLQGKLSSGFVPVLGTCSGSLAFASPFAAVSKEFGDPDGSSSFCGLSSSSLAGDCFGGAAPGSPSMSPSAAAVGCEDAAPYEVMRMSLEQLQRLWQGKIDRLQQLLKLHGPAPHHQLVCGNSTTVVHSGSSNSCYSYLGEHCCSSAGVKIKSEGTCAELLMQQFVGLVGQEGVPGCSTGSFAGQGQQELQVPSSPWHSSWFEHQQQEQQQQEGRRPGSVILDLSKPGEAGSPRDSCTSSPMISLQQQSLSGGFPGTPGATFPLITPSPFLASGFLTGPTGTHVGCAGMGEAPDSLGAVQREVEGLVGVMVVMMMGSRLKWQAFAEMDMTTGQQAPTRQLRSHWGRMLVSLRG
jgi:hypothetical protein